MGLIGMLTEKRVDIQVVVLFVVEFTEPVNSIKPTCVWHCDALLWQKRTVEVILSEQLLDYEVNPVLHN